MHVTNGLNVEASINLALQTALNAITPPAYLPQPAIVFDWPEIADRIPCFSIAHMPTTLSDVYQGRNDSDGNSTTAAAGMLEVSAWVSRDQLYNGQDVWMPRLRYMESMITSVYTATPVVIIQDFTNPASPTNTNYRVTLRNLNFVQTADDPNPAIKRRRGLLTYYWNLRA